MNDMEAVLQKLTSIEERITNLEKDRQVDGSYAAATRRNQEHSWPRGAMVFHRRSANSLGLNGNPWFPPRHQQGINRSSTRTAPTHQHLQPPHTPPARSENIDFPVLAKKIFQYTQIRRCGQAWEEIPKNLNKQIDEIFGIIKPPIPDDRLTGKLNLIRDHAKSEIVAAVNEHLASMDLAVTEDLKKLNPTDKQNAAHVARSYVKKHFGQKIPQQTTEKWIQEALAIVGEYPQNPSAIVTTESTKISSTPHNNKRLHSVVVGTQNRFQVLTEYADEEVEDNQEEDATAEQKEQSPGPSRKRANTNKTPEAGTPNQHRQDNPTSPRVTEEALSGFRVPEATTGETTAEVGTRSGEEEEDTPSSQRRLSLPFINGTNKAQWRCEPQQTTKTVIIADSNFRRATNLPEDWEVQVFPGMNLEQATMVVGNSHLSSHASLEAIIISVGINNRKCTAVSDNIELGKLYTALAKTGKSSFYLGISIPKEMPKGQVEALTDINLRASKKFGSKYIQPLSTKEVSVHPNDPYKIHYDQQTANAICDKITKHFLSAQHPSTCDP